MEFRRLFINYKDSSRFFHDQNVKPVTLTLNDRFELDGNRLIVLNGGSYGTDGSIYSTERESFYKITAHGSAGGGPAYFTVETKEGTTMEYGNSAGSVFKPVGSTVYSWLLNRVTDSRGNYMDITYTTNAVGEILPQKVSYTGHIGSPTKSPYNEVRFLYSNNRTDVQNYYVLGTSLTKTALLTGIETYANTVKVNSYDLSYTTDFYSKLASITKHGTDGTSFPSTIINYNASTSTSSETTEITDLSGVGTSYFVGDFNGDGYADIFNVPLANGSGPGNSWNYYANYTYANNPNNHITKYDNGALANSCNVSTYPINRGFKENAADYDGDGQSDVLVFTYGYDCQQDQFTFYHFPGADHFNIVHSPVFSLDQTCIYKNHTVGDFDGDGRTDIFVLYTFASEYRWDIYSWNKPSNSFQKKYTGRFPYQSDDTNALNSVDIDGDGKQEVLVSYKLSDYKKILSLNDPLGAIPLNEINKDKLPNYSGSYPADFTSFYPADFNGDGKTDFLMYNNGLWKIYYSTGGADFEVKDAPIPNSNGDPAAPANRHEYLIADFNGDNMADIVDKYSHYDSSPQHNLDGTNLITYFSTGGNNFTRQDNFTTEDLGEENTGGFLGDFNGDGYTDIIYNRHYTTPPKTYLITFFKDNDIKKAQSITNGLGVSAIINYSTLTKLSVNPSPYESRYTQYADATFPLIDISSGMNVVDNIVVDDGIGGIRTTEYSYRGAKIHMQGLGFLGFCAFSENDLSSGIKTENIITSRDPVFFTPTMTTQNSYANGVQTSSLSITNTVNLLNNNKGFYSYASSTTNQDLLHKFTVQSTNHADNYGNIDRQEVVYGAQYLNKVIVNTYEQKAAWCPSRLLSSTVSMTRPGQPYYTYTRATAYINSASTGLVTKETMDPGQSKRVVKDIDYDSRGNLSEIRVSTPQPGILTRTTHYDYDDNGRFVIKQTNSLGHFTQSQYEDAYGNPTSVTDVNLHATSYTYDGFGRLKQSISPTGVKTTVARQWLSLSPIPNTIYSIQTSTDGLAPITSYFDIYNRELLTRTKSYDGRYKLTQQAYNGIGQIAKVSDPYFEGSGAIYTENTYDDFGRISTIKSPSGTVLQNTYNSTYFSYSTTTKNLAKNTFTTKTYDATGALIGVSDDAGTGAISYLYNSNGNIRQIDVIGGSSTKMEYDIYGRQTKLIDPDAGTIIYDYNAFGELASQTTARGLITTMKYDQLGRVIQRIGDQATAGDQGTTNYYYDNYNGASNSIGLLVYTEGFNDINIKNTYDPYSRLSSVNEYIQDITHNYTTSYEFDNLNRVTKMNYPSGFSIKNEYNTNDGSLQKVLKVDNTLIWQGISKTERGQIDNSKAGNGLSQLKGFDNYGFLTSIKVVNTLAPTSPSVWENDYTFERSTGNLITRTDGVTKNSETFEYDKLDRLTKITPSIGITQATSYSPSGNITSKYDAGSYAYQSAKPHAVTDIYNPKSAISVALQSITYTPFEKIETINEGEDPSIGSGVSANTSTSKINITYGPDYERRKQVITFGVKSVYTPKYYSGSYEISTSGAGDTRELYYINGGDGLCAIYVRATTGFSTSGSASGSKDSMCYIYIDHLGSYTYITSDLGLPLATNSYDAWGRRRNQTTWKYDNLTSPYFDRGYTGHEHLEPFKLINMNGRVYDPVLGRMLSPDNYVQASGLSQNYNRYSYCLNNPLKFTDPDGNNPILIAFIIGAAIGAYSGGTIANGGEYNPTKWDYQSGKTWGYMAGGAIVGGASGALGAYVATSGMAFANTAGIMAGSFSNSVGMNMVTGGQTDVSISFGFGSYNFDSGEFGYLGKPGNSGFENIGYGLGALANISDGVNLYDSYRAASRAGLSDAQKQAQYESNYKSGNYDEFVGPNGNADPSVARANGHNYETKLGEGAYSHDVNYYGKGADGWRSGAFNTRTLGADKALLQAARGVRQAFRAGVGDIATYRMAAVVRGLFIPAVGLKYAASNAFLFSPLTIKR